MAISALHYCIIRDLFLEGALPQAGALLELGEANWYGDTDAAQLAGEIDKYVGDLARRAALRRKLAEAIERQNEWTNFDVAKVFYQMFFSPSEVQAIDFGGSATAQLQDLNAPVQLDRRFDVVINHGTAEHIFNVSQVFRTMHEWTAPGGVMIHEGPLTGWIDHGFYTFHPTLFYDLAEANGYHVTGVYVEEYTSFKAMRIGARETFRQVADAGQIPFNAMLLAVLTKGRAEQPFQTPRQRGYRGGRFEEDSVG